MNKSFQLRRVLLAMMGVLVAWWMFTLGFYFGDVQANRLSIVSLTSDIRFNKYLVSELRKGNTESVIEKLQGTAKFDEVQIKFIRQALDELTVFSFATAPCMTIIRLTFEVPNENTPSEEGWVSHICLRRN